MKKSLLFVASVGMAAMAVQPAMADTYTFNAQYFVHDASGDFEQYINGAIGDEVLSALGPNGMPVYNTLYSDHVNHPLTEVNSTTHEIQWWTPSAHVTTDGTGTVTSPYYNGSFYPSQGTGADDSHGYQTAIFTGTINLATDSTVNFTFGGDDDVFLYMDGNIVAQLGGVHANTPGPVTSGELLAGSHQFEVFFADRHTTGAVLQFSIDTQGLVVTPGVPEPATWGMMLAGFGALGLAMRRRRTAVSFG